MPAEAELAALAESGEAEPCSAPEGGVKFTAPEGREPELIPIGEL